jgi:hypothetical protein
VNASCTPASGNAKLRGVACESALLIARIADKGKTWDGREFRKADFLLALFINDGKGGYRVREVNRFTNQVPAAIVLSVAPVGKVRSQSVLQSGGRDPILRQILDCVHDGWDNLKESRTIGLKLARFHGDRSS